MPSNVTGTAAEKGLPSIDLRRPLADAAGALSEMAAFAAGLAGASTAWIAVAGTRLGEGAVVAGNHGPLRDVSDLTATVLGMDRPLITEDLGAGSGETPGGAPIRFFTGFQLRDDQGRVIGALCLADAKSRRLSAAVNGHLTRFARLVQERLLHDWQSERRNRRLGALDAEKEAAKRQAEEFEAILEGLPVGLAVVDADGILRFANALLAHWLGGGPEDDLPGRHFDTLWGDDAAADISRYTGEVLAGAVREFDVKLAPSHASPEDGPRNLHFHCLARVEADIGASGQGMRVHGFVALVQDTTFANKAAAALAASERRLRDLADLAADWVWETDTDHRFSFLSPRCHSLTGWEPGLLIGKRSWELDAAHVTAENAALWAQHRADMENHRPIRDFRYWFHTRGGKVLTISVRGKPRFGNDGTFEGYLGTVTDVTDLVETQRALISARDEAEKASKAKSEFLSAMSHELRTPLNAILGFGTLLEDGSEGPLTDRQGEAVHFILKSGGHLLKLVDKVLDLARLESGHLNLQPQWVSLEAELQSTLREIRPQAETQGIALNWQVDVTSPEVRADPVRLRQCLMHLMDNAVRYNRPGGLVRVLISQGNGGRLRLSIQDTGSGIPDDRRDSVFKPFTPIAERGPGANASGLGLALTRRLIEDMDGIVGFESTPDRGSTFWFELPGKQAAHPAPAAEPTATALIDRADNQDRPARGGPKAEAPAKRPLRLLYVEDNPANLTLMSYIIDQLGGFELMSAHTAEMALILAKAQPPDLVIMDLWLPGMDGIAAIGALRRNAETRDVPVIALSADGTKRTRDAALSAGCKAFIGKPFVVNDLRAAIDKAMESD